MILVSTEFIILLRSRHYVHSPGYKNPSYTIADIYYDYMFRRGKKQFSDHVHVELISKWLCSGRNKWF